MQPISILLMFIIGYITLLTMTSALSEQQISDMRVKRSLADKRFYDFGSRSVHANDDDLQILNDEYDRYRRFYDFGTRKRFYDFGSKKRSDE